MYIRSSQPIAILIASSLLLAACSGDNTAQVPASTAGHGGSDGGLGGGAGAGGGDASPEATADGPQEGAPDGSQDVALDGWTDVVEDGSHDSAPDGSEDAADDVAQDTTSFDAPEEEAGEAGPGLTLRVMAANLTSGSGQSYDPGHGIRIFQGLKPDVVMIQEFNYGTNTDTSLRAFVDEAFGTSFVYYRQAGGQIPNGVISRYPILQSGEWDDPYVSNRDFAWAKIDLPGAADLWAVSVHLLTSSASERSQEAKSLIGYLNAQVPPGDLLVLGGDFNVDSRTETCIGDLAARFITVAPWPVDEASNDSTNHNRNKPYDWVLASPSLHATKIPLVIGSKTFPSGLVFDSRVYSALSEVPPILKSDSDAPSMQHMAVVRAFLVH